MTTEYELLKIKRYVLKVNMHCPGCVQNVRKILRKIDGVYMVNIDAEEQLVMVVGSVDPTTLISKLVTSGKHAELCSAIPDQLEAEMNSDHAEDNQTQDLNIVLNSSEAMHVFPMSFGGKENHGWGSELSVGQRRGTATTTGQFNQDLASAMNFENMYMGGDAAGAGFVGFGSQEFGVFQDKTARPPVCMYGHLQPVIKTTRQAYFNNDPLPPMVETSVHFQPEDGPFKGRMETYRQDWNTNYSMSLNENDKIYSVQPQIMSSASNLIPSYTGCRFMFGSAAPHDYN